MQEGIVGVKRLLRAIYTNVDDENRIKALARFLNYQEGQLRQDIEAIELVTVTSKDAEANKEERK